MERKLQKTISYRLQFINSARIMANSLSNLANNLVEGIHKNKYTNCNTSCLEYENAKGELIEYKCLCCNKNYQKKFDESVKKRFTNRYKFADQDINKFILLL